MIIKVERAVHSNKLNPNGYKTINMEEKLKQVISNNKLLYCIMERTNYKNIFNVDPKEILGEVIDFNNKFITVRLYEYPNISEYISSLSNPKAYIASIGNFINKDKVEICNIAFIEIK